MNLVVNLLVELRADLSAAEAVQVQAARNFRVTVRSPQPAARSPQPAASPRRSFYHQLREPPLLIRSWPLIHCPSGEHRKSTRWAVS